MSVQKSWTIGRSRDCDLVVSAVEVSSRHCRLHQTDDGLVLEDLGSVNGTYVNGKRIEGRVAVRKADIVTLGAKTPFPWPQFDIPKAPVKPQAGSPPTVMASRPAGGAVQLLKIGRSRESDFVIDQPGVSSKHATLTQSNGQYVLKDLQSSNGVAIGHPRNRIREAPLKPDDVVYFGTYRIPAAQLLDRLHQSGNEIPTAQLGDLLIAEGETIIGRSPDCDVVLDCPLVSNRHARFTRQGKRYTLEDLRSSNGTFLNQDRISEPTVVSPGDRISLGSYTFTLNAAAQFELRSDRHQVTVEARAVGIVVPGKNLIDDCSLTIYPTEIVGLMGPSGAGKTTFMRALNGYTPPTQGQVMLNGDDLYQHFDRYRNLLGYVPQDDIIHGDLTVFQALYYSARLRLPPDFSNKEIGERVRKVLTQLHLDGAGNVLIGSPEKKGISGGQRKRVNLAMELLTDPLVLFLDEPTSGLSSEDARVVMEVLRELADSGKTILITIHQPGLDVYKMLDNLVMVGKDVNSPEPGRILFYGPAFPDAIQFFNPGSSQPHDRLSPDELFSGLKKRPADTWRAEYRQSDYYRDYVGNRAGQGSNTRIATDAARPKSNSRLWLQWQTLVARGAAIKLRDRINSALLLAQAPVVGLLLVLVFGKQARADVTASNWAQVAGSVGMSLFLMGMAALWFGASNAVREIVGEWAIYRRERMVNLRIPAYVASKFTVLAVLSAIQCLVLLLIAYVGCGLKASWIVLFIYLLLASFVGVAIGLTLSALARTSEIAITLLPIVLLGMVFLGGAVMPLQEMGGFTRGIASLNPARWVFEGVIVNEALDRPRMPPTPIGPMSGAGEHDMAEKFFPKEDSRNNRSIPILVLMLQFCLVALIIVGILKWRDRTR